MSTLLLVVYFAVLSIVSLLGVHRSVAVWASRRYRPPKAPPIVGGGEHPRVLIQLPLYNEAFVAERLLRTIGGLRYPRSRLRIQVLDDSTDGTRGVVDRVVAELRQEGVPIEACRRTKREGFKAGALAYGLLQAPDEEMVAIFDADFLPESDFLERVIPILAADATLGLVQTRWGHLNRDASLLTRAQGVFLDGHFSVEHAARAALLHPFNFNGTAGVWRRRAIEEAGGWASDTITEDLDLSYRAQLAGWKFAYAHNVVAPAELPESWAAFRAQQARWVRGSVETARKLLGRVLRSPALSPLARADSAVHLVNNFAYLLMALLAALLPAALIVREELGWRVPGGRPFLSFLDFLMLGAGTLAMVSFYLVALHRTGLPALRRLPDVLFALCLGAGMSVSNAAQVLYGLRSQRSEFVRTPKKGHGRRAGYAPRSTSTGLVAAELALAAYHASAVVYALQWQVWGSLPFLLLYLIGFSTVGLQTALEARRPVRESVVVPKEDPNAFGTRQG